MKFLSIDNVEFEFIGVFAAQPGFFVLEVMYDDGDELEPITHPVLFWAIESQTYAPYPITLDGVKTENTYILQPDGSVERPGIDGYPDVHSWLAHQKKSQYEQM